jgi:hypothetical protein
MKQSVNILGTEYEIISQTEEENPKLEDLDGLCEIYSKKIVLCDIKPDKNTVENFEAYKRKVLRHEIVHAFLEESGLSCNTDWARNEEMVDWIAIQFPKMLKAFESLNILD